MEKMKFDVGNTINKNSRPLKNLKYRNPNSEYAGDKFERENMIEMNSLEGGGGSGMGQVQSSEDVIAEIESETGLDVPPEVQTEIREAEAAAEGGAGSFIAYSYQTASRIWRDNNRSSDDYEQLFFDGLSRDAPSAQKVLDGKITDPNEIQTIIDNLNGANGGWLAKKDENRWIRNREQGIKSLIEQLEKIKKTGDIINQLGDYENKLDFNAWKSFDQRTYNQSQISTTLNKNALKLANGGFSASSKETQALLIRSIADIELLPNSSLSGWGAVLNRLSNSSPEALIREFNENRSNLSKSGLDQGKRQYAKRENNLISLLLKLPKQKLKTAAGYKLSLVGQNQNVTDGTPTGTGSTIPPNVPPGSASQAGMNKIITYGMVALLLGYLVNIYMKKGN